MLEAGAGQLAVHVRAMVLAAGLGTRLRPLTHEMPKPLMPVANRPVMEHIIRLLARHGFGELVTNTSHLPEMISDRFGDGSGLGMGVYIIPTPILICVAFCFFLVPLQMEALGATQAATGRMLMIYPIVMVLLVAQFRSYILPLVIMAPIPLTMIGIMPGHALLGREFTATSMIGMIALAGIIVRNSILLVVFIRQLIEEGVELDEAVVLAGAVRIKPIAGRTDKGGTASAKQITGFTDARAFSRLGTRCFGFSPLKLEPRHDLNFSALFHGIDERVPVDGYTWGQRLLFDTVSALLAID